MTLRKTNEQLMDDYDEMLRECYSENNGGTITVCGIQFDVVRILRELDPIAYKCGFNDYIDSLEDDF